MDANFISIVQRLVNEKGQAALFDVAKAKALLEDYARNEYKRERHLLLIAIEAGAPTQAIWRYVKSNRYDQIKIVL